MHTVSEEQNEILAEQQYILERRMYCLDPAPPKLTAQEYIIRYLTEKEDKYLAGCVGGFVQCVCILLRVPVRMFKLCFHHIFALGALDRVLFGCSALMVGSMLCEVKLFGTTGCRAGIPVTCFVGGIFRCPAVVGKISVGNTADIADRFLLTGSHIIVSGTVSRLGAVDLHSAADYRTILPVIGLVT